MFGELLKLINETAVKPRYIYQQFVCRLPYVRMINWVVGKRCASAIEAHGGIRSHRRPEVRTNSGKQATFLAAQHIIAKRKIRNEAPGYVEAIPLRVPPPIGQVASQDSKYCQCAFRCGALNCIQSVPGESKVTFEDGCRGGVEKRL